MNLKSAYDSLQKKELEQRKTIKQMSERIKELEALVSKNESLHLVSQCNKCKQPLKGEKVSNVGYNICTCNWDTSNCG